MNGILKLALVLLFSPLDPAHVMRSKPRSGDIPLTPGFQPGVTLGCRAYQCRRHDIRLSCLRHYTLVRIRPPPLKPGAKGMSPLRGFGGRPFRNRFINAMS